MPTIRCLHCGSPVKVLGSRWECGYCGDFGSISSPPGEGQVGAGDHANCPGYHHGDRHLRRGDSPQFSRSELEDMVRRWDFDENEWACQDLLIAAFPEAVRFWTAEELSNMDTMELLGKVGE